MQYITKFIWIFVAAAIAFGIIIFMRSNNVQKEVALRNATRQKSAAVVKTKANIGGPFELVDHTGTTVTEKNYAGLWKVVYFGFTTCPDVCPTGLQAISNAMDMLPENMQNQVQPLFISVDPDRDTPPHMAEYVALFHPRLVGLTGTPEQVAAVAKEFKVFYQKVPTEGATGYLVDHSTFAYLMTPDNKLEAIFRYPIDSQVMAATLKEALAGQ